MTREFSLGALLSITTGRLLCDFGDMHECCEFLAGEPIFTHQFAYKPLADELKAAVLRQHPGLACAELVVALGELCSAIAAVKGQRDEIHKLVSEWMAKQGAVYGDKLALMPMAEAPKSSSASFTEPLRGKDVIVVHNPKREIEQEKEA